MLWMTLCSYYLEMRPVIEPFISVNASIKKRMGIVRGRRETYRRARHLLCIFSILIKNMLCFSFDFTYLQHFVCTRCVITRRMLLHTTWDASESFTSDYLTKKRRANPTYITITGHNVAQYTT